MMMMMNLWKLLSGIEDIFTQTFYPESFHGLSLWFPSLGKIIFQTLPFDDADEVVQQVLGNTLTFWEVGCLSEKNIRRSVYSVFHFFFQFLVISSWTVRLA